MEKGGVPEIDEAAEEYVDIRDRRMALTKDEKAAQTSLLNLMKKHKLKAYDYDNKLVSVVEDVVEKVKVKAKDKPEADDGDDDAE